MSLGKLRVLMTLAVRSLLTHKVSSAIVGSIIFFGTFLVVVGTSFLDTIEHSMAQSVTSSVAGHLQVYSATARDSLALFGGNMMAEDDIGEMPDFAAIKQALEGVDNVKAVIPMGFQFNTVSGGNDIDLVLGNLREAIKAGNKAEVEALRRQILAICKELEADWKRRLTITADKKTTAGQLQDLTEAQSDNFWVRLDKDPEPAVMFLETHLAPLATDTRMIFLRNLGTDLQSFSKLFDRFKIVEGSMVPAGKHGFLFSKRTYEKMIKNRVARELDAIHTALTKQNKSIAGDTTVHEQAARLPRQYQGISFQLRPAKAQALETALRALLPEVKGELSELLQAFLTVNDDNFAQRYAFFYANIAPDIRLYNVAVGDNLTLRAFTKSGYLKSANVKVYGTFDFEGLESSDIAGAANLVDMETFRDLYGFMNAAKRAELDDIKKEVGLADVNRDKAEAELFGAAAETQEQAGGGFDEFKALDLKAVHASAALADSFSEATINDGLAINAAVLLKNPSRLEEARKAIEAVSAEKKLDLKVVDWQTASGMVGQFIIVVRIVLYIAIFIIFLVALVIINNAMVMATMERVTEIGTMRAMGAQRNFVLVAFMLETLALGLSAGALGAVAGAGTVSYFGAAGIPAINDIMAFLFSGPRLYPSVGAGNILFGVVAILLVSLVSTFYPARIATRIQPIVAMQAKE